MSGSRARCARASRSTASLIAIVLIAAFLGDPLADRGDAEGVADRPRRRAWCRRTRCCTCTCERRPRLGPVAQRAAGLLDKLPDARARCATRRCGRLARRPDPAAARRRSSGPGSATRPRSRCCRAGRRATSLILLKVARPAARAGVPRRRRAARIEVYRGTADAHVQDARGGFHRRLPRDRPPRERAARRSTRATGRLARGDARLPRGRRTGSTSGPAALRATRPADGVRRLLQRRQGLVGRLGDAARARRRCAAIAGGVRFESDGHAGRARQRRVPAAARAAGTEPASFEPALARARCPRTRSPTSACRASTACSSGSGARRAAGRRRSPRGRAAAPLARPERRARAHAALRPLDEREAALVVTPPATAPIVTLIVGDTTRQEGGDVLVALQPAVLAGGRSSTQRRARCRRCVRQRGAGVQTRSRFSSAPICALTYAALRRPDHRLDRARRRSAS